MNGGSAQAGRLRTLIRRVAECAGRLPPITVEEDDAPPALTGDPPANVFPGDGVCRLPGGTLRSGWRVRYCPSTLAVTMGAELVRVDLL